MALPTMNSDPTAVDRVPNAQPVTPATTVAEARGTSTPSANPPPSFTRPAAPSAS